jgi:hypothetical protein
MICCFEAGDLEEGGKGEEIPRLFSSEKDWQE